MVVIGLTGGIACGKSAVAAMLAERGVAIVDADQGAREVVAPGSDGLSEVVAAFGEGVLSPDGSLDRKRLGERVFGDEEARKKLNAILHPRIAQWSAERFMALAAEGRPFAVYEAALLVENGAHRAMGGLIVVTARPEVQRARLMARDGIDAAAAQARIDAQWPLEKKVAVATEVIDNSGDREALRAQVLGLHTRLVEAYGP
ncbi:MAG: dephospho-CoA kinase [Deltaproteobacteria bacterium]|nr:dephospho-CoA kinase [Deltaproteobacteria bacterium]